MKYYAIIVAGGRGSRMKTDLPKQFLLLNGLPVLMHTIKAFYHSSLHPEIILVLNESYLSLWKELCISHSFDIAHSVIAGGEQRFNSVKNGLSLVDEHSIVAVHDAVRPLVSKKLITRCFKTAEGSWTAIPAVSSRDSLRKKEKDGTVALDRDEILIVQTPQVFVSAVLKEAYQQAYSPEFTDDASVVEKLGIQVNIVEGEQRNIKITYQDDLAVASLFLKGL